MKKLGALTILIVILLSLPLTAWGADEPVPQEQQEDSLPVYPEEEDPMEYSVWWTLTVHQTKEGFVVVDVQRRPFEIEPGGDGIPAWNPNDPNADIVIIDDDYDDYDDF